MTMQALAVVLALAMGAFLVRSLLRRNIPSIVWALQIGLVPSAGFTFYAVSPAPSFNELGEVFLAVAIVLLAIATIWSSRLSRVSWGTEPVSTAAVARVARIQLALKAGAVLAASSYLALFEPLFAVINLLANAAWAAAWTAPATRILTSEGSIRVAEARAAVWSFLVDPENLGRWRPELQEIHVTPDGPLQAGSRIDAVRSVPLARPWQGKTEMNMTMSLVVSAFEAGSSYTTRQLYAPARTTTRLSDAGAGTDIAVTSKYGWSMARAIAGEALAPSKVRAGGDAILARSLTQLKQLLEQA